jgi:Zn-dependent peptidase ImmA (M78 family)
MMTAIEISERAFRAKIVLLIINGKADAALRALSTHYEIEKPDLRVGTVKAHRRVLGCYVHKEKRIYISKSDLLTNPFVILHEFYHHLRASHMQKRGQVEKRADSFALAFIREFTEFGKSTF